MAREQDTPKRRAFQGMNITLYNIELMKPYQITIAGCFTDIRSLPIIPVGIVKFFINRSGNIQISFFINFNIPVNKKLRISEYIKREEKVRILYGLMNSNHKIEQGLEIFDSKEGRRILDYAFFEYRIGMRKIPIARFLVQLLKNKKLYPKLIKIFPKEKLKRLNITRIKRFLK